MPLPLRNKLGGGRGQPLSLPPDLLRACEAAGLFDVQLAHLLGSNEDAVRQLRRDVGVQPVFKLVDTCAAEFEAYTPYYYSTYEEENESTRTDLKKDHDPGRRTQPHRPGD